MAEVNSNAHVVIVGAGHSGGTLAMLLRQFGHTGKVTLIGDETMSPYQRPPLSKAFLKGEVDSDSLKLRPDRLYAEKGVTLHLGATVEAIDPQAKVVRFADDAMVPYDVLVLATGARARDLPVPGAELNNIHRLRSLDDAERLQAEVGPDRHVAIIGGGYVGLEVAASARALGASVTVIERESRILARVASETLSRFFHDYHTSKGCEIMVDSLVEAFVGGDNGYLREVRLADGRSMACDVAVVGVGAACCDQLARDAGIECGNGIVVDSDARTSHPDVFAIGDVSWRPLDIYDGRMARLESVPNAMEQAKLVASALTGRPRPAPEVPWFWSDQYELKLQIAGLPIDVDGMLVRGSPEAAKFAVFHLRGEEIVAVEAVNMPAEFMGGRQLIGKGVRVDLEKLADQRISMKEIAA